MVFDILLVIVVLIVYILDPIAIMDNIITKLPDNLAYVSNRLVGADNTQT